MNTPANIWCGLGRGCVLILVATLAACSSKSSSSKAPVEVRGSDPTIGAKRAGTNTLNNSVVAAPDANGIITYDGYQSVISRSGDTVASIADRIGMSASELGAYNGLSSSYRPQAGDELVLPPRPGGYGDQGSQVSVVAPATTPSIATTPAPQTSTIQQTPIGGGVEVNPNGSFVPAPTDPVDAVAPAAQNAASDTAITDAAANAAANANAAPSNSPQPQTQPAWSPDIAAAAIKRSTGIQADGSLGQPPSAAQPVPPEPAPGRELASPGLGQYQTGETPAAPVEAPQPNQQVAAASTASSAPSIRLRKPVSGPIAVGFNKGSGPARNDGVDFAAAAGSPVVAAADGEVALVSQSLGGLGTIVLVRHANELLTVYGRIDGVLVNKGDVVSSGQQIGIVSDAAAPAEPRMHFEVRRGAESLDPQKFL